MRQLTPQRMFDVLFCYVVGTVIGILVAMVFRGC